jgi:hypothetical protein
MHHGRHRAAGASGETEELHKLQFARGQADSGGISGFQIWSS